MAESGTLRCHAALDVSIAASVSRLHRELEISRSVVNPLDHGENFPLSVHLLQSHVIHPARGDQFGGGDATRDIEHSDFFSLIRLGEIGRAVSTNLSHHFRARLLAYRNITMNHVLQIMRVQGLLHPTSIARVIRFDVVRHRGAHGRGIINRRLTLLSVGRDVEKQETKGDGKAFHWCSPSGPFGRFDYASSISDRDCTNGHVHYSHRRCKPGGSRPGWRYENCRNRLCL